MTLIYSNPSLGADWFDFMNLYEQEFEGIYENSEFLDFGLFKNKTILFTGASGLIGRYFVDFLMHINKEHGCSIRVIALERNEEKGKKVFCDYLDDPLFSLLGCDVTKPISIEENVDFIIHAASPANPKMFANYPVDVMMANLLGTKNMLELSREKKVEKMLFVSSGEVYGMQTHDGRGFKEEQPGVVDSSISRSCYTESKRCAETMVVSYFKQYGVPALALRSCYIYGPTYDPSDSRVIFQFLNNYFEKQDIVMKSDGKQIRSYCYISDCLTGLLTLLSKGKPGEMYNLASNESVASIKEIAEAVVSLNPSLKIKYEIPAGSEAQGFSPFQNAIQNPEKLMDLGWKPKIALKEGIERTAKIRPEL